MQSGHTRTLQTYIQAIPGTALQRYCDSAALPWLLVRRARWCFLTWQRRSRTEQELFHHSGLPSAKACAWPSSSPSVWGCFHEITSYNHCCWARCWCQSQPVRSQQQPPPPGGRAWSSSSALMARRSLPSLSARSAAGGMLSSGSKPRCASSAATSADCFTRPKRRGSQKAACTPPSSSSCTWPRHMHVLASGRHTLQLTSFSKAYVLSHHRGLKFIRWTHKQRPLHDNACIYCMRLSQHQVARTGEVRQSVQNRLGLSYSQQASDSRWVSFVCMSTLAQPINNLLLACALNDHAKQSFAWTVRRARLPVLWWPLVSGRGGVHILDPGYAINHQGARHTEVEPAEAVSKTFSVICEHRDEHLQA